MKFLNKEVKQFQVKLKENFEKFERYVEVRKFLLFRAVTRDMNIEHEQRCLAPQSLQHEQFQADQSLAGEQCVICMEDIEIGRNMMRLDCDGQHTFCKVCIEGWFNDHKTCPICRHGF